MDWEKIEQQQENQSGLWNWIKKMLVKYRHFIIYCLIGFVNTAVDWGAYTLLLWFGVHYLVANIFSYHCGIVCSFVLNGKFNYKIKDKWLRRFLSFYVICLCGFGLSTLCLYLCVDICALHPLLGKVISTFVVLMFQFLLAQRFSFKK